MAEGWIPAVLTSQDLTADEPPEMRTLQRLGTTARGPGKRSGAPDHCKRKLTVRL